MAESPIASVYVTVIPETSRVAADIKKALRELDSEMRETGRRWGKELEDGIGPIKPEVKPETVDAKTELEKFRREQERKKIRQQIEFDEADAKGKMAILRKEFDGVGGALGGGLKVNLGLAAIGTLPAAATALTDVAGAIQQVAGAGLVLPAVFAGILSSVGVAALGMHGMSDAFTALGKAADGTKASVNAANDALAKLPPSSADAVKTVYGLKGTFEDLQKVASANLFQGFSGDLKRLVAADLPAVTRGVDGISRGLNTNLRQAMTSLGSGSSQGFLTRIFGNTANAQGILSNAIDPIVHAMGTLTAAGSDALPRLATAIGNVAERFNNFITAADGDGRLAKWISDGLDGFRQLGDIVLNVGKIFTGITEANGGGAGFLGWLDTTTSHLEALTNSTAGQNKIREFFQQGRDMLGQLRDIAVQVGPILGGMFQAGTGAASLWLPVIRETLQDINQIPGGAAAVVGAFAAWKTISGVASLASALNNIVKLLEIALPGAAATGAAGISKSLTAGLAGITLPAWMTSILGVAGGAAALVSLVGGFAYFGNKELHDAPNSNENARARGAAGLAGAPDQARPTDPKDPMSGGGVGAHGRGSGAGLAPLPAQAPTLWGYTPPPGSPAADAAAPPPTGLGSGANYLGSNPVTPDISTYAPPVITEAPKGGSTPNLPYTGTADPNAGIGLAPVSAGAYANDYLGPHTSDTHGKLTPNADQLRTIVEQMFPAVKDIGGYRAPDGYNEHSSGEALDIMVGSNKQLGDQINQFLLQNANALGIQYDLWQQTQWNPDGSSSAMEDRGGATANHRDHVHARVRPGPATGAAGLMGASSTPMDPMYSGMGYNPSSGGLTSQDLSLRNAQQRVNDTQHSQEQAEARLNELRAKGTATDRQMEAAEYAVAKAKREHQDAIDGLTVAQDKYNKSAAKGSGGSSDVQSLGSDLFGGVLQAIGLDGSLFKNPFEGGLWKGITGAANFAGALGQAQGGGGGGMAPAGGGGDLFGGLLGLAQNFMPGAPNPNSPNILDAAQFKPPGAAGPGNVSVDNSFTFNGTPTSADSSNMMGPWTSQNRYAPLAQNLPR